MGIILNKIYTPKNHFECENDIIKAMKGVLDIYHRAENPAFKVMIEYIEDLDEFKERYL